jgi:hypothetical protein
MTAYAEFLASKAQFGEDSGFDPIFVPDFLYDFQKTLLEWAVRKGRCAIFADCGLGKTPLALSWAENIIRKEGGKVLFVTPLAVSAQIVREGEKFGIQCTRSSDGTAHDGVTVTNYERLHYFNSKDFIGVICDESSAIKNYEGKRQSIVTAFLLKTPYRLFCTATAAPNDFIELGTSAEALGYLGRMDMLGRFFKNDEDSLHPIWWGARWRFKAHAEPLFWKWVCSWARAIRKPSDIGGDDTPFVLPPLIEREHVVGAAVAYPGELFPRMAQTLAEQRTERRNTLNERCGMVAELVQEHDKSVVFCHLNDEGDLLEKLIPSSVQVKGSDTDEYKEKALLWFLGDICICNDDMFRAKLSTWQKETRGTGSDGMRNTESRFSLHLKNAPPPIQHHEESITKSTTKRTRINTSENQSMSNCGMQGDARDTLQTWNIENARDMKSNSIERNTLIQDGQETFASTTASPLPITIECLKVREGDALFANGTNLETKEQKDTTSITAIPQEESGDCSALPAIWESENSEIIHHNSNGLQCICGHQSGIRRIISKPVMFGFGLNLQNCSHMTFFPSHSYEQYYQGIRRCWRFGQKNPVTVDIVTTPGELGVLKNLQRKSAEADRMFTQLMEHMHEASNLSRATFGAEEITLPSWL